MIKKIYGFSSSWVGTIVIVMFVIFFIAQAFVIPSRSMVGTLYEGDMLFVKKFSYGISTPRIPWLEIQVLPDFDGDGHILNGSRPLRGDIVVFIPPHLEKIYYVKRTFGVGGDEVIYKEDGFYLRPYEGDEYIVANYPKESIVNLMGKMFVKDPYMKDHPGISYKANNSIFYDVSNNLSEVNGNYFLNDAVMGATPFSMTPIIDSVSGSKVFYKKIEPDEFFMIGDNRDNSLDSRYWGSVPYKNIIGKPWFIYFSINLNNSIEARDSANHEDSWKYTIRWHRMFKGVDALEKQIKREEG